MRPVVFATRTGAHEPARLAQRDMFVVGPERLAIEAARQVEDALVLTDQQIIEGAFAQIELGHRRLDGECEEGDDDDDNEADLRRRTQLAREARVSRLLVIVLGRLDERADRAAEGLVAEAIFARQMSGRTDRYLATWVVSPVERPWRPARAPGSLALEHLLAREFLVARVIAEGADGTGPSWLSEALRSRSTHQVAASTTPGQATPSPRPSESS